MTGDRPPLAEVLAKSGDRDVLRAMAGSMLQLLTGANVEGVIGAGRLGRHADRQTCRNSYRDRTLETRWGPVTLQIPKLRTGRTSLASQSRERGAGGRWCPSSQGLYRRVSTRRVDERVQAMGLSGISRSSVSKLCRAIEVVVGDVGFAV